MTGIPPGDATMNALDPPTRLLVRLAVVIGAGTEAEIRSMLGVSTELDPVWVEELILQTYLFAGFPRALNAARAWRRLSGRNAPTADDGTTYEWVSEWARRGEETCAIVYGEMYRQLRVNIRHLHPALDTWMIVEGYGKVLSRPGLDLKRRELCIIAVCAAADQERQLHSHLHGALNAGATSAEVSAALDAIADMVPADTMARARTLWTRVRRRE
jgi:4-carboxymuconolactone decarboxylase